MTQRYTREQLFERSNALSNKREEEREKEEIERKIKKLKDNEEDMLIALKKFDDDMAMQISRQKREIERVKERIQDLKQELNFNRGIDTQVKSHQSERKNFISAKYSPNYYYSDKRAKDTSSDDSKDFFEKQRERKIKTVEAELKSLEERLTETQRDYESDRKRKLDELKELQHQTRVQATEIRQEYEDNKRERRQAERDEEDKQRRHKEIERQVDHDLETERTTALRASLNTRGSSNKPSYYSRALEKKEDEDEDDTSSTRDKYKIDRVLPPMRRKKYYY